MPSACVQGPQGHEPAPRGLHEAHLRHGAAFNPTALLAATAAPAGSRGWRAPRGVAGRLGGVCDQSAPWARAEAPVWHSSTSWSPNWSQGPFAPSLWVLGPSLPHNEHSTTAGSCTSPIQAGKMCRAVQDSHIFLSLHPIETSGNGCAKSTLQQSPGTAWDRLVRMTQTLPHIPACPVLHTSAGATSPSLAVKAPSPQSSPFLRARLLRSGAGDVLHRAPAAGRAAPHRGSGMCGPQALPARITAQPLPWNKKVQMSP